MNYKSMTLALFFLVGGFASSNAQDIPQQDVPQAVKTAFNKAYPKAKNAEWEMKGLNYEVDFDLARVDHKITYSATGKRIAAEKDVPNRKLPAAIAKNIKTRYPNGRVDDVDMVNTGGKIAYKIDIEGTPDVKAWYEANGKFIKETAD